MARPTGKFAKLTAPTLPRVIERTRLFRLLDKATKSPLTWIAAPPGAGKTTLLTSYLQKRARTVLWYRLDAGDADPATLFHYLGLAVQAAAPRFRTRLPHLTPEYFAGLPIFTQRYFEQLGSRFRRPTVLVFDNYQEVAATSIVHQLLPVGIQHLPNHVRVVILSREGSPNGYVRLQAEQQLRTIQAEELELTRDEARQVYRLQKTPRRMREECSTIDQLWELAQGWMAGFILMTERKAQQKITASLTVRDSPQTVFDYLASEVMERFPQDTQKLLTTMSILSDFTPRMAEALSGLRGAADILEQLHQSRYFIERLEDRIGWYRYHPLFREFLLRRAEQTIDPSKIRELRCAAATLLLEVHSEEDAVSLLQQAEAWEDCRALLRMLAPVLLSQGRTQMVEAWIRQLPDAQREADPWMDYWMAHCRIMFAPKEACALYETALGRFRQQGDRAGTLLSWAGVVQSIIVSWTGMRRIHDLVRLFDQIHPSGTSYPSIEVEAVVAQAMAGAYSQMFPNQLQAREWLDRSLSISHCLPVSMIPTSAYMTEIYYLWFDDVPKAQEVLSKFEKMIGTKDAPVSARVMIFAGNAVLSWFLGEPDRCRQAVRDGLILVETHGLQIWNGLIFAQAIYNELFVGNTGAARDYLDKMKPICHALGGIHLLQYWFLEAWANLIEGHIERAWETAQQAEHIWEVEGHPMFAYGLVGSLNAQVLYAMGQRSEASGVLAEVESVGWNMPSFQLLVGVYLVRAQWAFDEGDEQAGASALRQAVAYGRKTRMLGFVGWVPQMAVRLFAKALALGIEVPYVIGVIRKRQLKPPSDGSAPENWPWRVKIHTLGSFKIEVDDRPLSKSRKAPHRLLDLVKVLIAAGGSAVTVTRLMDMLWPEAEGDQAQENLKKSIARLRRLLGVDHVIQWQDGKVSLNRELCWVDAWAFEASAKRAEAPAAGVGAKRDHAWERQAIALYKGPFLGLDEIPGWAESRRDQVRTRFIRLVRHHCDQAWAAGHTEEAIRALEEAIDVDPVAEPLYQRLIPLLAEQGRQADAASIYDRCKSALARWEQREPAIRPRREETR